MLYVKAMLSISYTGGALTQHVIRRKCMWLESHKREVLVLRTLYPKVIYAQHNFHWKCHHTPAVTDFLLFSWTSGNLSCFFPHLFLNHPHFLYHPLSLPTPSLHLLLMTIIFSLLSEIQASLLCITSFLISCVGSVKCCVRVLYFMANIYL